MRLLLWWTWLALAGVVMAAPADAQLLLERLFLWPGVVEGPGQVRLKGMGGFQIAVPDENNEINLWDYAQNPAGYGDDRDSWGLDTRYTHDEFVDRSLTSTRDDLNFNTGFLELGYRRPGKIGVGGRLIYSELDARIVEAASTSYQLSGFSLFINKYFGQNVSVGAGFTSRGDTRDEVTNAVYNINHSGSRVNGILGVAYTPVEGVLLGGKAELGQSTIDGESIGPFHTDTFEWTRPTSLVAVHGFLSRGRVNRGADFSRGNLEGDETVRASWSERFVFNPTNEVITFDATTFTA